MTLSVPWHVLPTHTPFNALHASQTAVWPDYTAATAVTPAVRQVWHLRTHASAVCCCNDRILPPFYHQSHVPGVRLRVQWDVTLSDSTHLCVGVQHDGYCCKRLDKLSCCLKRAAFASRASMQRSLTHPASYAAHTSQPSVTPPIEPHTHTFNCVASHLCGGLAASNTTAWHTHDSRQLATPPTCSLRLQHRVWPKSKRNSQSRYKLLHQLLH